MLLSRATNAGSIGFTPSTLQESHADKKKSIGFFDQKNGPNMVIFCFSTTVPHKSLKSTRLVPYRLQLSSKLKFQWWKTMVSHATVFKTFRVRSRKEMFRIANVIKTMFRIIKKNGFACNRLRNHPFSYSKTMVPLAIVYKIMFSILQNHGFACNCPRNLSCPDSETMLSLATVLKVMLPIIKTMVSHATVFETILFQIESNGFACTCLRNHVSNTGKP